MPAVVTRVLDQDRGRRKTLHTVMQKPRVINTVYREANLVEMEMDESKRPLLSRGILSVGPSRVIALFQSNLSVILICHV